MWGKFRYSSENADFRFIPLGLYPNYGWIWWFQCCCWGKHKVTGEFSYFWVHVLAMKWPKLQKYSIRRLKAASLEKCWRIDISCNNIYGISMFEWLILNSHVFFSLIWVHDPNCVFHIGMCQKILPFVINFTTLGNFKFCIVIF